MKRRHYPVAKTLRWFEERKRKFIKIYYGAWYASKASAYNSWLRGINRDGYDMYIKFKGCFMIIYKK